MNSWETTLVLIFRGCWPAMLSLQRLHQGAGVDLGPGFRDLQWFLLLMARQQVAASLGGNSSLADKPDNYFSHGGPLSVAFASMKFCADILYTWYTCGTSKNKTKSFLVFFYLTHRKLVSKRNLILREAAENYISNNFRHSGTIQVLFERKRLSLWKFP